MRRKAHKRGGGFGRKKNSYRDYKDYTWVMCLKKTNAIIFHFHLGLMLGMILKCEFSHAP